ncbi:hypothetical protein QBC36DRAFT_140241 [Triangularia setosa]|uniref:Serine-rich protein n=1 Tax=Triangularia setosa TaxID=2587417 RepID=A0AAN6W8C3_9PEZI|nr:hypothetical protein QBC36DRAFT_140241 [Podospora setosa]
MSAPNSRHGPPSTPLHERSKSQSTTTTKPGIRLVPYTPPRIDGDERAPSQASLRDNASSRTSNRNSDDQTIRLVGHSRSRSSPIAEVTSNVHARNAGSALSSSADAGLPLARGRSERVSGMKPLVSPSGVGQGGPTVSALTSPSEDSPNITTYPASTRSSRVSESPSPAGSSQATTRSRSSSRAPSRRRTIIVTNPDKTFTIVRNDPDAESSVSPNLPARDSLVSPTLSYASRSSTHERPSILSWAESRSETPMTGVSTVVPDHTPSEPPSPAPSSPGSSTIHLAEDSKTASSSSPWNYRMVGGLRKVAQTPEPPAIKEPVSESLPSDRPLSPLLEDPTGKEEEVTPTKTVVPKASFGSAVSDQTIDTVSVSTNYKVYGPGSSPAQESNDSLLFNRPGTSNWEVLGESSPAPEFKNSPLASSAASSSGGENDNYVVYGGESSPSASSSLITVAKKPRPSYSQESLRVAPLRPAKKSYENFGYYKQRSRENLRSRTNSVHSLKSVASVIGKQDPALLVAPVAVNLGLLSPRAARGGDSGSTSQLPSWLAPPAAGSSSRPESSSTQRPSISMITATPHQWSSQLSTVQSESEIESSSMPTRSVSPLSESSGGHHRRRSSAGWVNSMHSRQMPSVSSSIAGQLEEGADTSSGSDSLHRPQPSLSRGTPQIRMVRDQDEHGDGIADLEHRPSRAQLSGYFTNTNSSSRGLHSSGSSRSRGNSFTSEVPAWARVYYGSGERRWLGRSPSFMSISESGSRPGSSRFYNDGDSPTDGQFPPNIYSPRKRAREVQGEHPFFGQSEMGITPAPGQDYNVFRTLRQKTSSIWSPHLRQDRRASRYSMWDPPSVNWSADTNLMGKRNIQVVLFIIGFIFPFAWMIAAILPLPKRYTLEKESESAQKQPEYSYQPQAGGERRFETVRWWRNLNRIMSVVGLLIIGAVISLAVVGVKQGWGQHS